MSIAYIADVHVGNHKVFGGATRLSMDDRCRATIETLGRAARTAVDLGCRKLVVAGDLVDTTTPTPQMLTAIGGALRCIWSGAIVGNHERSSSRPGDHALGWMGLVDGLAVWQQPACIGGVGDRSIHLVPFEAGDPTEWLPLRVGALPRKPGATLVIHLGLRDAETRKQPWFAKAKDAVDVEWLADLCFEHGITQVIAGNWHSFKQWSFERNGQRVDMTQCGALVPTGFDNPGMDGYGGLIVQDETGVRRIEIAGPRFINARSADDIPEDTQGMQVYVRRHCAPRDIEKAQAELDQARDRLAGCSIRPTKADKRKLRDKAQSVTDVSSMMRILRTHIQQTEFPGTPSRSEVFRLCAEFLNLNSDSHES